MSKADKITDRCAGHCCQTFSLPYSPAELWASYRRWKDMKKAETSLHKSGVSNKTLVFSDIHLIAPMVIYLGYKTIPYRTVRPVSKTEKNYYYTCKHFDKASKNCAIYEDRPLMCRSYPDGSGCNYAACTWEEKKEKPESAKDRKARLKVLTDPGGGPVEKEKETPK